MAVKKEVNTEKLKALQLTMEKLDKAYGKGAVMKLGDSPVEIVEVMVIQKVAL
jgi:recombination protein RecA